ncbi:hypothetical protein D6D02_09386 [Aureobasidium pullulans]|uniref:Acyl-CoA dehydrogenase NM domain-like protein n=1 Tax=Aureobasidium pullulans TaxID=5580 RepID=A0A4S9J962_AURPU|nr:hypothetical protein D6D02_09386 [Aureobasidium pullulans]THZ72821.1 hypothetical protein D6C85_04445 [Aureobasidium pullulans]
MGHQSSKPRRQHNRKLSRTHSDSTERPPPYTETPEEPWTTANQTPSKPPARTPSLTVERDEEILELHQRLKIRGKAVENLWKGNNKLQAELERLREYSTPDSEKTYPMSPYDNFIDYRDLANQHRQKIHQLHQQSRMEREAKDAKIVELEKQVRDLEEYIGKKESDLLYYQGRCTKVWEEAKIADAQLGRMSQKVMRLEVEAHASKRVLKSQDDHVELLERELKMARLVNTQHTAMSRGVPVQDGRTTWVLDSQQDEISVTVSRVPSKLDSVVDYLIESIAETKKKLRELETARNRHGRDPTMQGQNLGDLVKLINAQHQRAVMPPERARKHPSLLMDHRTSMAPNTPIPFSEPPYLSGLPSPYYSASHLEWQKKCRAFITEHLTQHAMEWETAETVPEHVFHDFSKANMLLPSLPAPLPVERLKSLGIHDILGLPVEEFDYFHNAIYTDEMLKSGLAGPSGSLTTGMAFGVPPIFKFGSKELQDRFLPDLLTGKKRACIAITEPDAGSDVANIQATAVKSKDGKTYTINGTKKWITNGIWSEISAGTTYIELDDVVVPAENLIGEEGMGMKYIMTNFNHERLTIAIGCARQARVALSAAFEYCLKREAFGKSLMDQPVVRHRLAKCGAQLEAQWSWTESFVYAMIKLPKKDADVELGGLTAAAKAQAGVVLMECAQCAVLLFGGNGFTRSGKGEIAEKMWREVPGNRIPGGSEDVLFDLSIRQLVKNYQNKTKMLERPRGSSKL